MTYRVFAPLTGWGRLRNLNHPLSAFRSSSESPSHLSCPATWAVASLPPQEHLPCGFYPFSVFPAPGSHITLEATNLQLLPSQRFSRSQGLTPPGTCRPYFMPVPPLGFYPPGFIPPAEPYVLSNAFAFLRLAILPVSAPTPLHFRNIQAMLLHAHGVIFDAAPLEEDPTSRPCSPRASVLPSGGLDRYESRDPHGLFPP